MSLSIDGSNFILCNQCGVAIPHGLNGHQCHPMVLGVYSSQQYVPCAVCGQMVPGGASLYYHNCQPRPNNTPYKIPTTIPYVIDISKDDTITLLKEIKDLLTKLVNK